MNLKVRLALSVVASFLLALLTGGMLAVWRANDSVRTEMASALAGGRDSLADIWSGKDASNDLSALVHGFDGQRHLQARLTDETGQIVLVSRLAMPSADAPEWFQNLIAPQREMWSARVGKQRIVLATDPRNEIGEVWSQTRNALVAMLVFGTGSSLLLFFLVVRPLASLSRFTQALASVAEGRYEYELAERGPAEFANLAHGFNHMAQRLAHLQILNGRLQEQMVAAQEEERADIARDLHDEVGPYLFAIKVDAGALLELTKDRSTPELTAYVERIADAATHIQTHVKTILQQLKPVDCLEFGLEYAIRDLFAFWRTRDPQLHFDLQMPPHALALDSRQEQTLYRVVQESLSNAVRHGHPKTVIVQIGAVPEGRAVLRVMDDGGGLPDAKVPNGNGCTGMKARLRSLGGMLSIHNRADASGVLVTAQFPLRPYQALA